MARVYAPRRRYLPSVALPHADKFPGAFCSKWEGFEAGWKWAYPDLSRLYQSHPTSVTVGTPVEKLENSPGVYVFLSRTKHVLYVGMAQAIGARIWQSLDSVPEGRRRCVKYYAVCQAASTADAFKIERALIYYYVPPWNRAIGHKPPQRGAVKDRAGKDRAGARKRADLIEAAETDESRAECPRCHHVYPRGETYCPSCEVAL